MQEHFFRQEELISLSTEETLNTFNNKEALNLHNTYFYEQNLYSLIQKGNVTNLEDFLVRNNNHLREGTLANTPLRQAKNIFISTVTKAGMFGAIPGCGYRAGLRADGSLYPRSRKQKFR